EAMRLVDTAKFADTVVTGAVADVSQAPDSSMQPSVQRRYLMDAKVRANGDVAKALEAYYGDAKNPLVWVSGGDVSDRAKAAMTVLADAATVGLDPADYA